MTTISFVASYILDHLPDRGLRLALPLGLPHFPLFGSADSFY
jgi:hypothetical protein